MAQWTQQYEEEKDKAVPKKKFTFARKQNAAKVTKPKEEVVVEE